MKLSHRATRLLVYIALFSNLVVCLFIAHRMPVFNHVDEWAHFDYVLKLNRNVKLQPGLYVEPDVQSLWERNLGLMDYQYRGVEGGVKVVRQESHELMQPQLFYRVCGWLLWVVGWLELSLEGQVVFLRMLCGFMVFAGNVVLYSAIARIWQRAGWLSAVFLVTFVPVDLVRFSNDTPAMVVGAVTAWCLVKSQQDMRVRWTIAIGLLLAVSLFIKLTAAVFLVAVVVVVKLVFMRREQLHRTGLHMALIGVPVAVCAAILAYANMQYSSTLYGTNPATASTLPEGIRIVRRIFSASVWQWWHEAMLSIETQYRGRGGASVYPVHAMVTVFIVGQVLALGWACFGNITTTPAQGMKPEVSVPQGLRRWIVAALLSVLALQTVIVLILGIVGHIWLAGRMILPVLFWPLLPACCGYLLLADRMPKTWQKNLLLYGVAAVIAAVWIVSVKEYLGFRRN